MNARRRARQLITILIRYPAALKYSDLYDAAKLPEIAENFTAK